MPLDQGMVKKNVVYFHNRVLHSEKNDILKLAGKGMDLENIVLCQVTHIQKDKYNM